jgi:branched-chain amino acid transport system substrate-binding protein
MVIPLLSQCSNTAETPEGQAPQITKELKIGVIFALTGPYSAIGEPNIQGIEACADWINDKGGITINGEQYLIKIALEDHKSTPEGAVAAANRLVYDENVKFILGPIVPPLAAAAATVTEEAKVLRCLIDGPGMLDELGPNLPYTFKTFSSTQFVASTYDLLVETYPDVKTVALVSPEEASQVFLMEKAQQSAEALGLQVVSSETYPFGTEDFYPLWTKILATEPDAVDVGGGMPIWVASVFKQGREMGYLGPMCSSGQDFVAVLVDTVNNKDLATDFICADFDPNIPEMPSMIKEIAGIIDNKYGVTLGISHIYGWEALWLMVGAIEEAQSIDPTEVAQTWEKMEKIESPLGTGYMGGLETYGVNHECVRPWGYSKVMNGEIEFIKFMLPEVK